MCKYHVFGGFFEQYHYIKISYVFFSSLVVVVICNSIKSVINDDDDDDDVFFHSFIHPSHFYSFIQFEWKTTIENIEKLEKRSLLSIVFFWLNNGK